VTSNYQTTNLVSPNFSQFEEMKKKINFGPKFRRNLFGSIKRFIEKN